MSHTFIHDLIRQVALLFPTFMLLFTVRGFFQAASARLMGDNTPSYSGFVTLNPLAHIDVTGVLMLSTMFSFFLLLERSGNMLMGIIIVLLVIFMGIRPYHPVPINPENFRSYSWGVVLTTLSGPFSYFFLTLVALYVLVYGAQWLGMASGAYVVIEQLAGSIVQWALFWGVIGLIPIPPFDASALLPIMFGSVGQDIYDFLEQYALFIFLILFFVPGVSDLFMHGLFVMRTTVYTLLTKLVIA